MVNEYLIAFQRKLTLRQSCESSVQNGSSAKRVKNFKSVTNSQKKCSRFDCPLFWLEGHNLVLCESAKVASTQLKLSLLQLYGRKIDFYDNRVHIMADDLPRVSVGYLLKNSTLRNSLKAIFVRHPFERLASAFADKLGSDCRKVVHPYCDFRRQLLKRVGKDPIKSKLSFHDFIRYLLNTEVNSYDIHWQPFWHRCKPCEVRYDFVGKLETFHEDIEFLHEIVNASDPNITKGDKVPHKTNSSSLLKNYYSQLSLNEMKKLYSVYKPDFDKFDYSPDIFFDYAKSVNSRLVNNSY
ncbi:Uncharacterised protein r2_g4328 [Pycnogonum litorale]